MIGNDQERTMRFTRLLHLLAISLLLMWMLNLSSLSSVADNTPDATQAGTQTVPNCAAESASATSDELNAAGSGDATAQATITDSATLSATLSAEATSLATQAADAPLRFISFLPTDMKFNPTTDN